MSKKPLVLVVEDDPNMQKRYVEALEQIAEVIAVKSFREARVAIEKHGTKIVGVTLDYNIQLFENERKLTDSVSLIFYVKEECGEIPIFAASCDDDKNAKLISHGALPAGKKEAHFKLAEYVSSKTWA